MVREERNLAPPRLSHGRRPSPIYDLHAAAPRVAVNRCPGDGAGLARSARPIAGQLVAIAFELQGALEASSVAGERHLPRTGGLRAVLHGGPAANSRCGNSRNRLPRPDNSTARCRRANPRLSARPRPGWVAPNRSRIAWRAASDFNFDLCPGFGFQISPGLVNPRPLAAQFVPAVVGLVGVLHGMIPH
jgi:hypothetical protein